MSDLQAENKALMHYPFGMLMPGRNFSSETYSTDSYRYGFNGKENDDEVKGEGSQQDYGFRIYDTRIGKFLSVDPLTKDYPWYTPYQFAGNKPIWAVDLDGLEEFITIFSPMQTERVKPILDLVKSGIATKNDIQELNRILEYGKLHGFVNNGNKTEWMPNKLKENNIDRYKGTSVISENTNERNKGIIIYGISSEEDGTYKLEKIYSFVISESEEYKKVKENEKKIEKLESDYQAIKRTLSEYNSGSGDPEGGIAFSIMFERARTNKAQNELKMNNNEHQKIIEYKNLKE